MALVTIKIRRMPDEPNGRILAWLVGPVQLPLHQMIRSHDVEHGWHAFHLLRSDIVLPEGKVVDDRPVVFDIGDQHLRVGIDYGHR